MSSQSALPSLAYEWATLLSKGDDSNPSETSNPMAIESSTTNLELAPRATLVVASRTPAIAPPDLPSCVLLAWNVGRRGISQVSYLPELERKDERRQMLVNLSFIRFSPSASVLCQITVVREALAPSRCIFFTRCTCGATSKGQTPAEISVGGLCQNLP
jgi:hypothetical protein